MTTVLQQDERKVVLMFPVNYDGLSINALGHWQLSGRGTGKSS